MQKFLTVAPWSESSFCKHTQPLQKRSLQLTTSSEQVEYALTVVLVRAFQDPSLRSMSSIRNITMLALRQQWVRND